MRHVKLMLLGLAGLVAVAGCATTGGYQTPEYRLSKGSTIELTQTLKFPTGGARTYIQDGRSVGWNDLDLWKPYCSFGLNTTRDHKPLAREIHPTKFTTGKTRLGVYAELDPNDPPAADPRSIFAQRGIKVAGDVPAGGNAGFPFPYTYSTTITLYSDAEPQVADLTCAFNGYPSDKNLTVSQIQSTLGAIAKIQ